MASKWSATEIREYIESLFDSNLRDEALKLPAVYAYASERLAEAERNAILAEADLQARRRFLVTERQTRVDKTDDMLKVQLAIAMDRAEGRLLEKMKEEGRSTARGVGQDRIMTEAQADEEYLDIKAAVRQAQMSGVDDVECKELEQEYAIAVEQRELWRGICRALSMSSVAAKAENEITAQEMRSGIGR